MVTRFVWIVIIVSMTDNFGLYRKLIELCGGLPEDNKKGNLDKFYVIELIRRGKDNADMPAANYHFKNYHIFSMNDLRRYEQEIKDICTLLNCRAYASVNYKLMSQIALDTIAEEARRIAAHDYKQFDHIFESCCGKYKAKDNNLWVVDVDDNKSELFLTQLIMYTNSIRSKSKLNVLTVFPTPSGYHLICHPFDFNQFIGTFRICLGYATIPEVKKNHLTLLFENL